MKNFAILRVQSVTLPSEVVYGQTIYRGVDEFTHRMAKQLHSSLIESGVECGDVQRSYKPEGSGFYSVGTTGRYFVSVGIERKVLPEVEVNIIAEPRRGAVRSWDKFEPLLKQAIAHTFPLSTPIWMTEDEFIESKPGISKEIG